MQSVISQTKAGASKMPSLPKDDTGLLYPSPVMKFPHLTSTKKSNLFKQVDDLVYKCMLNLNEDLVGICS